MGWWNDLFRSPARRREERDRARRTALTQAKTAIRRERRMIAKQQSKAYEVRLEAVQHEREGRSNLAKQKVRRLIQLDRGCSARSLALDNMEHALEQASTKDNFEDFMRCMQVVANIEELAHESIDPDEIRERLNVLAERNKDIIEPWMEAGGEESAAEFAQVRLTAEEEEAYRQVAADAAGSIEATSPTKTDSVFAAIDAELKQKMDESLGKG